MVRKTILLTILLISIAAPVHRSSAAGVAIITIPGSPDVRLKVEYLNDNTMRMESPSGDASKGESYSLVRDNTIYTVRITSDGVRVLDMGAGFSSVSALRSISAKSEDLPEVVKFENTGRKETVAGYNGEVYQFTYTDKKGSHTDEVVLSSNSDVREFSSAYFSYTDKMASIVSRGAAANKASLSDYLKREKKGALRIGTSYTVSSLSVGAVDSSRFELPAEPMEIPKMRTPGLGRAEAGGAGDVEGAGDSGAAREEADQAGRLGSALGKILGRR